MAELELIPLGEFDWTSDYSYQRMLTCRNHPTALYSTKNPWERSIHIHRYPEGEIERSATGECTCPFGDLVVIKHLSQPETTDAEYLEFMEGGIGG